jgi:flagellar biosynthesis protein FliQ
LYTYDEEQIVLLSGLWALLFAELGWLAYYWTFAYAPFSFIKIPQITLIVLLVSFMGDRMYRSWAKHGQIVIGEVILPVVFSALVIGVMVTFFNSVTI